MERAGWGGLDIGGASYTSPTPKPLPLFSSPDLLIAIPCLPGVAVKKTILCGGGGGDGGSAAPTPTPSSCSDMELTAVVMEESVWAERLSRGAGSSMPVGVMRRERKLSWG